MPMIRFGPFQPAVDPSFWQELGRLKMDEWRLASEDLSDINGEILVDPPKISLTYRSFQSNTTTSTTPSTSSKFDIINSPDRKTNSSGSNVNGNTGRITGKFKNLNTIQEFSRYDRADMISSAQAELMSNLKEKKFEQNVLMVTFADLKKYDFSYTIGIPSIQPPGGFSCVENLPLVIIGASSGVLLSGASSGGLPGCGETGTGGASSGVPGCGTKHTDGGTPVECYLESQKEKTSVAMMDNLKAKLEGYHKESTCTDNAIFQSSRCTLIKDDSGIEYAVWKDASSGTCDLGGNTLLGMTKKNDTTTDTTTDTTVVLENQAQHTFDSSFRNFLTLIWLHNLAKEDDGSMRIIVLRPRFEHSRFLRIRCDVGREVFDKEVPNKCFSAGWIKNITTNGFVHKIQLAQWLDPSAIASSAVDLNIKLMKWRLVPDLQPEKIQKLKFLLLGSGTLGCSIARNLLGWGVRHITFLDSGIVNYSNPVRQSLFTHLDAKEKRKKSECAFSRAKEVMPELEGGYISLEIPMPSHPHSYNDEAIDTLEHLIASHDVVCMLTDSRESRWLPTLMIGAMQNQNIDGVVESQGCKLESITHQVKKANKNILGVTVALGFDSFVVMTQTVQNTRRACYFCNDVTAPTDSITERTLDRQCTVVRPGVSGLASAVATELIASLTQHKAEFEASYSDKNKNDTKGVSTRIGHASDSLLGAVPPQIRGYLNDWRLVSIPTEPFEHCVCCSENIINEYRRDKKGFVKRVVEDNRVLEEVSGLNKMKESMDKLEIMMGADEIDEEDDFCLLQD